MKRASSTPSAAAIKRPSFTLSASQPPLKIPAKDSGPAIVPQLKVKPLPVKRFKHGPVEERQYAVELPSRSLLGRGVGVLVALNTALEGAFRRMLQDAPPGSRVQARIHNPNLHKHYISSPRLPREQLRLDHLINKLMAALQSDESIDLETTKFTLSIFNELTVGWSAGSLWSRLEHNIHVFLKSKKSICNPTSPRNRVPTEYSQMCVPLAIARELYALENPGMSRKTLCELARSVACRDRALQLVRDAGLLPEYGPFTFKQLVLFRKSLPSDVGLNIFDDCGPPVVRCGPLGPRCINLFIAYNPPNEDNLATFHAYSINSIKAFMNVKSFCLNCFKADNHYNRSHKCPAASCRLCKFVNCPNRENEKSEKSIQCELCLFSFSTQCCFDTHLLEKACDKVAKCPLCAQVFPPEKMDKHPCGRSYCPLCKKRHLPFEHCYVQGKKTKGTAKPPLSIWYADTECQEDPETKQHHANLVVLQHTNSQGEVTSFEYKGPNAMAEFTADCIKKGSQYSDSVVVFHNAAGYDAHLWFQELRKAKSPPKHVILKEQKLIAMELRQNGIKCRDSLQFLPGTPLAAFPDMFELQSGPKGDFPHRLNTPKWIQWGQKLVYKEVVDGVEHRFPLLAYFRPESKRPKQLQALKQWHSEMVAKYQGDPNLTYIPEEELLKYCYQDVRILREGFDKYRETWLEQYPSLEPLDNITFPSFNNRIYREVYMPEDSLCLLPPPGYSHKNRPYSKPAMAWLAWKQRELKLTEMRTARHAYEVKINGHFVDGTGVDRLGQRHVFEFHGCFYHGCPCNKKRTPLLDARLERTRGIDLKMQALGDNPESPYGSFKYHIDPKDFRENKALRALAKFSLNNIWGYLGKRNDVTQTEFTQSYARALELDNDPDVELTTLLSDDCEFLTLVYKDKNEQASRNGNICIAAMTTAYARLELYKIIDKYSEQVVYMDTDSVFLLLPPGMEPPPTSTVLGELKDEIHEEFGPGSYISSFSSIGPKSYTFQVDKDGQKVKEVLKFKGISLTAQALNVVNPAVLQQMTTDHSLQLNAPQSTIRKDIHKGRLWIADFSKQVRFSSNKRYIPLNDNEMMDSWPFGYCL